MKFNPVGNLNRSLTVQDLAAIINEDSLDTYNKFSECLAELTNIDCLYDCVNDSSQTVNDSFDSIYSYVHSRCNDAVSITMNDGDIIWMTAKEEYDTAGNLVKSICYKTSDNVQHVIVSQATGLVNFVNDTLTDYSNTFQWKFEEILSSLSESMNASLLVHRLTSLMQQTSITIADIISVTNDLVCNAGSDLSNFISRLRDIGTNIMPSTLLRLVQGTYKTIATTTVTGDTIDWNDNEYTIRAYAGTVIKTVLVTAAQIVGSVLLYAGNVVLKIAGAVVIGVGYVVNAVWTGVTTVAGEKAIYKPFADTKEFPMPIWQYVIEDDTILVNIDVLCPDIVDGQVYKLSTCSINYYLWYESNDDEYRVEAYLTTSFKGMKMNKMLVTRKNLHQTYAGGLFSRLAVLMNEQLPDVNLYIGGYDYDSVQVSHDIGNRIDSDLYMPTNIRAIMNQQDMHQCLINALYLIACDIIGANSYDSSSEDFEFTRKYGHRIYSDAFDLGTKTVWSDPYTLPDPTSSNWNEILTKFIWNCSGYVTYVNNSQGTLNTYEVDPFDVTWSDLINKVIPAIKYANIEPLFMASLGSIIADNDNDLTIWSNKAYDGGFGEVNRNTSLFTPSHFREDYEIIPPQQEPGTLLKILIITAAVTAVVTTTVVVAKSVIKKALRRSFTSSYNKIAAMQEALQSDPSNQQLIRDFNKAVRKYNFRAGLFGYSTLSFTSGWENGDGASSDAAMLQGGTTICDTVTDKMAMLYDIGTENTETLVSNASNSTVSSIKGDQSNIDLTSIEDRISDVEKLIK